MGDIIVIFPLYKVKDIGLSKFSQNGSLRIFP